MSETEESKLLNNVDFGENLIDIDEEGNLEVPDAADEEDKVNGSENKTTATSEKSEDILIDLADSEGDDITSDSGKSSSSPEFSSIVTALSSEGFIDLEEGELDEVEDLAGFLRTKLNEAVDKRAKSKLTDKQLKALEAYEKGVPLEELVNSNARKTAYSSITEAAIAEDETLQRNLVYSALLADGVPDAEARDLVKMYEDKGDDTLKTKAISSKTSLVEREKAYEAELETKAAAYREAAEKARQDDLESIKKFVNSQKEIVPGVPLNETTLDTIYSKMTTPVDKDESGTPIGVVTKTRLKDPVKFDMLMTYYHELGLFNEEPDFSIFNKIGEKKAAKGLDALLSGDTGFISAAGGKSKTGASDTDEDDLGLDIF